MRRPWVELLLDRLLERYAKVPNTVTGSYLDDVSMILKSALLKVKEILPKYGTIDEWTRCNPDNLAQGHVEHVGALMHLSDTLALLIPGILERFRPDLQPPSRFGIYVTQAIADDLFGHPAPAKVDAIATTVPVNTSIYLDFSECDIR